MTTVLTWKKRTSKARRAAILTLVKKVYPDAKDEGAVVSFSNDKEDLKPFSLLIMLRVFTSIGSRKK